MPSIGEFNPFLCTIRDRKEKIYFITSTAMRRFQKSSFISFSLAQRNTFLVNPSEAIRNNTAISLL